MLATSCRRAYDHRMRDLVCEEHDPGLFRHLGVPRSTAERPSEAPRRRGDMAAIT